MINSYPSVYAIGHKAIEGLFSGPVVIEEKVDGSQFSFGVIDGELQCRSKGKNLVLDAPEKMFVKAIETTRELTPLLMPGWVYRCEFLGKPKHNTLCYARTPAKNLILYDVNTGQESYLLPAEKQNEARRVGLEYVPCFFQGIVTDMAMLKSLLETESCLGGTKIEGVVAKNYALFTGEKKVAMGKYVSEAFKETHAVDWKERNPSAVDVVQRLIEQYHTDARWNKAIQHLKEAGRLEGSPRDIGMLMREVPLDILKEEEEAIKTALMRHFWPHIMRGATAGLPEWYKQHLAESAFADQAKD
jgi:RNA ligase